MVSYVATKYQSADFPPIHTANRMLGNILPQPLAGVGRSGAASLGAGSLRKGYQARRGVDATSLSSVR